MGWVEVCNLSVESVNTISNPVRTPLVSNSSGLCHVISMDVEDIANVLTLVGGPLGAVYVNILYTVALQYDIGFSCTPI